MGLKGFVDLQVNGWRGVDFSSTGLTMEGIRKAARELAARGTAAFCPTVITSSWAAYGHALPLLAAAADDPECGSRILGIHLEGPFISAAEGAVGAHPRRFVLPPDIAAFDRLYDLCRGRLRILTLAPELPLAVALIRRAVGRGVRVSLGHTLAGEDDVARAVDAGASLSTHLGNGCPALIARHRNPIWAQLGSPLTIMMIADGHHLPPSMLNAFLLAKAPGKAILTSDSAPVAGLPPGEYDAFGSRIRLTETGRIESLEGPWLAGSASCLLDCVNFLASMGHAEEDLLLRLARDNPLESLGLGPAMPDIPAEPPVRWTGTGFEVTGKEQSA